MINDDQVWLWMIMMIMMIMIMIIGEHSNDEHTTVVIMMTRS